MQAMHHVSLLNFLGQSIFPLFDDYVCTELFFHDINEVFQVTVESTRKHTDNTSLGKWDSKNLVLLGIILHYLHVWSALQLLCRSLIMLLKIFMCHCLCALPK
jgi:hypothetical protein